MCFFCENFIIFISLKTKSMKTNFQLSGYEDDPGIYLLQNILELLKVLVGQNMPANELMDSADVKQKLKISSSTLYRYKRDGKITSVKIGGKIFYLRSSIEKLKE